MEATTIEEVDEQALAKWEMVPSCGNWASNIREVPMDLPAGFRFKATLHPEVADNKLMMKSLKRLDEVVRNH
ncbi:hypothetical protein SLEP1_g25574 [Rubroshorea leprosula]|uniref:Uncharacterized protein n=1 Tax=Rubroshorea leprosula TaxID=152421 RepID=A0AAV5JPV0_9ROSI|nr:hypothetical protein SLEP1_g25574 [Rubroshorea leprosula]